VGRRGKSVRNSIERRDQTISLRWVRCVGTWQFQTAASSSSGGLTVGTKGKEEEEWKIETRVGPLRNGKRWREGKENP